jgi:hypothetical protein
MVAVVFFALGFLLLIPSLVAGPATPTATTSGIPPVIWELVRFRERDRVPVTITEPSRYTVQFLPAGHLLARLDCHHGRGGYTAAAGVLTHVFRDGKLYLALPMDAGILAFAPTSVAPPAATPAPG